MIIQADKKIYIFLDESGKPEVFSGKGINLVERGWATKFLVIAAVRTFDQLLLHQQITDFKAQLLKDKNLNKIFSASYTLQRNPGRLYGIMAGQLLKNLCHQTKSTEIIFSRKDSKLQLRKELEREVEQVRIEYLQKHPNLEKRFKLSYFHNPHYSHSGLQIADYVAFAVFQVFERGNKEWYELVKNKIGKIQDICNKKYFTRSNPL